jgi:inorganic pyrophosphatase
MLKMKDEEGEDNKILVVPIHDHFYKRARGLDNVQEGLLNEIDQFFRRYKELEEGKDTDVVGWFGKKEAKQCIMESAERYKKTSH